jgi:hypothetical protein
MDIRPEPVQLVSLDELHAGFSRWFGERTTST